MDDTKTKRPVPRIALRVGEAAEALGMSEDAFHEYVAPELPWVRRGRMKLVGVEALRAWVERNQTRTLA